MKKVILVLVLFALVFGCVEDNPSQKEGVSTSQNLITDQNAVLLNPVDVNLFRNARLKKDVGICNNITDSLVKSRCFMEFALDTNNFDLCNKIEVVSLRINCEKRILEFNKSIE